MKYAFLSSLIPKELEENYRRNTRNTMQDAANALQWNLYEGLCSNLNERISLFNVLPVDSFPQYYRFPFVTNKKIEQDGFNIGFCNIKFIRNYAKTARVYKEIKKWCKQNQEKKVLFVYTLSHPLLKAICRVKREFPNLLVCAIVADLPNMSSLLEKSSRLRKLFVQKQSDSAYQLIREIDCFVLLTKQMAEYMDLHQPFCVVEGIVDEFSENVSLSQGEDVEKVIMYSGTLHKRFGVLHLVDAFSKNKDENFRLVLCGIGDGEEEICKAVEKDSRICFLGQLKRNEVLELQRQATVLVNPRMGNESFTKYSFPSKTMEYLASGVPVVAYKLEGIPDEYDSFIQYPQNNTVIELTKTLEMVCSMEKSQRDKIGEAAKSFVTKEKNKYAQTKKIIEMIRNMEEI